jgi:hypothetical protein
VRNRRIAKHANDVEEGIGIAERREVEKRLCTGLRAACPGNVGELDRCRHVLLRLEESREAIEPLVGNP